MPWDPTRDLLTMQEQLDSLFGRATTGWVPAADLHETPDRYVLTLEVPGLTRADVEIEFRNDQLSVRGERPGAVSSLEERERKIVCGGGFTAVPTPTSFG